MTRYGICPSFANWTSRLPLFADPILRGRQFEIFDETGVPTGDPSPLGPDGWPAQDGRWHGVRLFGDMDSFMPELGTWPPSMRLRVNDGKSAWVSWRGGKPDPYPMLMPRSGRWHRPSIDALGYFRPKVLRTLDWGYQARKEKRPDWSAHRVLPTDPLQGEEMALELHCDAANALNCHLWWNAPPRFELSVADYEKRLEEMLGQLQDYLVKPPILEYGNELWNDGFPVKRWLEQTTPSGKTWHVRAAEEIETLKRVADRVFGEGDVLGQSPFWIFVGGHIGTLDTLEKILRALSFAPDIAGPAFYVTPLKADKDRWQQTGEIPTQDQLAASMKANFPALRTKLDAHRSILRAYDVPYLGVYEAGQSLISNGRPWKKAALEAQRSEWMGGIYSEIRRHIQEAGVEICNWYSSASSQAPSDPRVDPFGLLESTLDKSDPPPKAKAAKGIQ